MRISPSGAERYDSCPYSYYLHYEEGIRPQYESVNLVFGKVLHKIFEEYLIALNENQHYDTASAFREKWREATETKVIDYTSMTFTPEDAPATGEWIAENFPAKWEQSALTIKKDEDGLMLERKVSIMLPGGHKHNGLIDAVVLTDKGETALLDFKVLGQKTPDWFVLESSQLKSYQMMFNETQSQKNGESGVDKVGYMEMIKRKVPAKPGASMGPEICAPHFANAFSRQQLREHQQKLSWTIDNIRKGVFPKTPRMSYNTPCTLCDFRRFCYEGDKTGLTFPEKKQMAVI